MGKTCREVAQDLKKCCIKMNGGEADVMDCVTNKGQEDDCTVRGANTFKA